LGEKGAGNVGGGDRGVVIIITGTVAKNAKTGQEH